MKEVIKKLKELNLYNPQDLKMVSDGHGEFPDGYVLSEKGLEKILEIMKEEITKSFIASREEEMIVGMGGTRYEPKYTLDSYLESLKSQ